MLTPNQKESPKLMPGCTTTHTEYGHRGTLVMEDTVWVVGDVRSVKLLQKVNLKLMPGYTITPMEYGHPGTLDMEDTG